jgi:DNA-binding CsgD family transcriptional regulator
MTTGLDTLTDKEKTALRLLLRGHDAKSSARELGLSVHTVNERLRDARRKLGVTSSREAARRLLAEEASSPESEGDKTLGDRALGDASVATVAAPVTASATRRWAGRRLALPALGVLVMSLILAALLLPAHFTSGGLLSVMPTPPASNTAPVEPSAAAARAAEDFLKLVDESRWTESYAATGGQFRELNTEERWAEVSEQVRPPLGKLLTRDLVANEYVPAPPEGYRLIKFRSTYANGTAQTESLSLAWEEGAWKVVGVVFD